MHRRRPRDWRRLRLKKKKAEKEAERVERDYSLGSSIRGKYGNEVGTRNATEVESMRIDD